MEPLATPCQISLNNWSNEDLTGVGGSSWGGGGAKLPLMILEGKSRIILVIATLTVEIWPSGYSARRVGLGNCSKENLIVVGGSSRRVRKSSRLLQNIGSTYLTANLIAYSENNFSLPFVSYKLLSISLSNTLERLYNYGLVKSRSCFVG